MRRKTKYLCVGSAVVAVAGLVAIYPSPHRVTRENAARIATGMRLAEVRDILGPPGNYSTGPVILTGSRMALVGDTLWNGPFKRHSPNELRADSWLSDEVRITVSSDNRGILNDQFIVRSVDLNPAERVPQPALENLLWRVQRRWRAWFPASVPAQRSLPTPPPLD